MNDTARTPTAEPNPDSAPPRPNFKVTDMGFQHPVVPALPGTVEFKTVRVEAPDGEGVGFVRG